MRSNSLVIFLCCSLFQLLVSGDILAQTETDEPQSIDDLFGDLDVFFDTLDIHSLFPGLEISQEDMDRSMRMLDSLDMPSFFDGVFDEMNLDGRMYNTDMDSLMEQTFKMLEGIDMSEFQEMLEPFMQTMPKAAPNEEDDGLKKI